MTNPGFLKRQQAAAAIRAHVVARAAGPQDMREPEDALHMRMAFHLHCLLPGANPRTVIKATTRKTHGRASPAILEPAHAWAMWWHTPNQGDRTRAGNAKFSRMGMRTGFADFAFAFSLPVWPAGNHHGNMTPIKLAQLAVIEAKTPAVPASPGRPAQRGGVLSPEQERFRDDCQALGVWWGQARSVRELDALLRDWLAPWAALPVVPILELGSTVKSSRGPVDNRPS
jgi:hypothetical protein